MESSGLPVPPSPYPDLFAAKSAQVIYDTITGFKAERAARAAQVTRA